MYDWAHGLSDSIEGITHSLCSLEFEVHRPLYDWCLIQLGVYQSQQIEFSRLNISYTVTSKRKLKELIELGMVTGWDDPRMPTLSGLRRRGVPAVALRDFASNLSITKTSDGVTGGSILDVEITAVDQRTALCIGSANEVDRFNEYLECDDDGCNTSK